MLDLNAMKVEKEIVKFGDDEFIVNPDLPDDVVKRMQSINSEKVDMVELRGIMIDIFSLDNGRDKSEKFINSLGSISFQKVVTFVSAYFAEVMRKKD